MRFFNQQLIRNVTPAAVALALLLLAPSLGLAQQGDGGGRVRGRGGAGGPSGGNAYGTPGRSGRSWSGPGQGGPGPGAYGRPRYDAGPRGNWSGPRPNQGYRPPPSGNFYRNDGGFRSVNPGQRVLNDLSRFYGGNYGYGYGTPYSNNPPRYGGGYRYGSGYRGFPGQPYGRIGLGAAYGPYGYGYFPWYGGLGLYGGVAGLNRVFGNGIYGSGYYNSYGGAPSYRSGGVTYSQQPSAPATVPSVQPAQPQLPQEDYVPQVNEAIAQLLAAANGNAALGIVLDGRYPQAAVIRTVNPGSAAEAAGMRPGDMIAAIDEQPMQRPRDVVGYVAGKKPGDELNLQYVRPIPRSQVRQAAPEPQPGTVAPEQIQPEETPPPSPANPPIAPPRTLDREPVTPAGG